MNCQGSGLFNQFLVSEISQYLNYKHCKSCKDKEFHSGVFIRSNEKALLNEFCRQKCPFRQTCSLTKSGG